MTYEIMSTWEKHRRAPIWSIWKEHTKPLSNKEEERMELPIPRAVFTFMGVERVLTR